MQGPLILDRYRPLETKGEGGSGTVELCWDTRIQRRVAIKRMPLQACDGSGIADGLTEARTGAMLNHPNIVSVIDFETTPDEALLIMEAIEGPTLSEVIDETPAGEFDLDIAASIVTAVGAALDFAHENQVLHLDIKPDNILVTMGGITKVSDFGISELADAQGFGEASAGTIGYMPPEQMQGLDLDQRCDEFALAVVTYEILTGMNPFIAPTLDASLQLIDEFNVTPPSEIRDDVDPDLDDVLLSAMDPERGQRYETIFDFCEAIAPWLGNPREGSRKLKALLAPDDEFEDDSRGRREPLDLGEIITPRSTHVLGRVLSAALCWLLAFIGIAGLGISTMEYSALIALAPAIAAAVLPQLGAGISLAAIGAGIIGNPSLHPALGIAVFLWGALWLTAIRSEKAAAVNVVFATAPLGIIGMTPLAPLAAGYLFNARQATAAAGASALLALTLGCVTKSGSMLNFGSLSFASSVNMSDIWGSIATPYPWIIIVGWMISAILMSLLCGRSTRVSSAVGAILAAATLVVSDVLALRSVTGNWQAPELNWIVAILIALVIMVVIGVLCPAHRDEGEE